MYASVFSANVVTPSVPPTVGDKKITYLTFIPDELFR